MTASVVKKRPLCAWALLFLCVVMPTAAAPLNTLDTAEFGPVTVYGAVKTPRDLVILFNDGSALTDQIRSVLANNDSPHVVVATIDTRLALSRLANVNLEDHCLDIAGPLEWVSQNIQHQLGLAQYRPPLLLGSQAGAALVYVALAQAPPRAFVGGMSVDFSRRLLLARPLCAMTTRYIANEQLLQPNQRLDAPWLVTGSADLPAATARFKAQAEAFNGVTGTAAFNPAALAVQYQRAAKLLLPPPRPETANDRVDDLPVVEVEKQSDRSTLAIIYSGDGGWRDIDRTLGDLLKARGFAVIGVDALRYFWTRRTPEETGHDLQRVITHYRHAWSMNNIVLIGYSFGADILPFAYNRLDDDSRAAVVLLSLLAAERRAEFEIHIFAWVGNSDSSEALSLIPEIRRIETDKLLCIYGEKEAADSLCTAAAMQAAERWPRPGAHHFDENYTPIAETIVRAVDARLASRTTRLRD